MFNVQLFTLSKERNSTKRPSGAGDLFPCTANMGVDAAAPQLPFSGFDVPPLRYNYAYIPTLERYYWIERWTHEAGLWVANCTEDVLSSWRDSIGATDAYILRSSAESDGAIVDDMYPATGDVTITTTSADIFANDGGNYVLGTVSGEGITDYVQLNPIQFKTASAYLFSDDFHNIAAGGLLKAQFDPMQYIKSSMWFPWEIGGGRAASLKVGWWDTNIKGGAVHADHAKNLSVTIAVPKHPQAGSRGKYLNLPPYSQYTLDCRPWGRIAIDPLALQDVTTITLDISVDMITGVGLLAVVVGGKRLTLTQAQVGIPIQLSQVTRDYLGAATSVVGGVLAGLTGNYMGAASAIGNAASSLMGQVSTTGCNGGISQLFDPAQLTGVFLSVVDEDNARRGRPLCSVRRISAVPGYIVCADPAPDFAAPQWELDAVRAAMQSGFYFE